MTDVPSKSPSTAPQLQESSNPTSGPTGTPTSLVTNVPTAFPTSLPMLIPSPNPTSLPSSSPSSRPTTLASSQSPSLSPSNPPTLKCNLTEIERKDALSDIIKSISSPADVDTIGTPQNLSSNWLINIDSSYICPDDQNVAQRYIMGVFYYSTRGDRWRQCQAPIDLDDLEAIEDANLACSVSAPIGGGSNAWLTPSTECTWGGLLCDSTSSIATIDFGKLFMTIVIFWANFHLFHVVLKCHTPVILFQQSKTESLGHSLMSWKTSPPLDIFCWKKEC